MPYTCNQSLKRRGGSPPLEAGGSLRLARRTDCILLLEGVSRGLVEGSPSLRGRSVIRMEGGPPSRLTLFNNTDFLPRKGTTPLTHLTLSRGPTHLSLSVLKSGCTLVQVWLNNLEPKGLWS